MKTNDQLQQNGMATWMANTWREEDKKALDALWLTQCQVYNNEVSVAATLMSAKDPTRGVRLWFGRDDLLAWHAGEAILISVCTPIRAIETFWHRNRGLDGSCHEDTPSLWTCRDTTGRCSFAVEPGT